MFSEKESLVGVELASATTGEAESGRKRRGGADDDVAATYSAMDKSSSSSLLNALYSKLRVR